jgi:hypothetical protein
LGEQRRRSTRIEQTSAVIIRGVDLLGQPFEERAAAQNLSFHGCCYASKHHLPKNTWITLEVPSSGSREEAACVRARVAWIQRPRTLRDLFQVGVELERGRNIWGVTLAPVDWSSGGAVSTMSTHSEPAAQPPAAESGGEEASLEVYLQMALTHANRDFAGPAEEREVNLSRDNTLLNQMRQEFLAESKKIIEEARAAANEVANDAATEMRRALENERGETAEAHQKWMEELEHGKVVAKEEMASALSENVAAQLAHFEEQVRGALANEWTEKLSQAQAERPQWAAEIQALREEMRANAEASEKRSEDRLAEKLREIRREWESSGIVVAEESTAALITETDTARAQWHELLESSLDSAARRLGERLSGESHELMQRTQQELSGRVVELQKESGLAAEMGRAALNELKDALEGELSKAKTALVEIEHSAGRFSEYSRQLEAASQDSVNELRQRLESSVARQSAELDRHATETEKTFGERAAQMLEQMSRESVAQGVEQIGRAVTAGLARAAKATEELAAREEQAEGILRIHRERLRQVSEQAQREAGSYFAMRVATAQKDLEQLRVQALSQWKAELASERARAADEASAALAKESERRLVEADAQLLVQSQQTIDSAQERLQKGLHTIAGKFRGELTEIEASQIARAREKLDAEARERLESATNEFTKAAEAAASALGEVIKEAETKALQTFSVASEGKAEEARARLVAAGENVLAGVQSHAQSSFEHFQEQLAIKVEQASQRASETLGHQLESMLEQFRIQGESRLEDWSAKQESMSEQALEKHNVQLQNAATSWVEMTLERLDSRSEERVDSTVCATENAIREACADIFENMAQMMKKQLQGTLEIRTTATGSEINPQEHRASA